MSFRDSLPTLRGPNFSADWKAHYESRSVDPEQALSHVKSGDMVAFARGREPQALGLALAARKSELENVRVSVPQPGRDFGWYDEGWDDTFHIEIGMNMTAAREALNARRIIFRINNDLAESSPVYGYNSTLGADVFLIEISPPDEQGFCSFGASVWDKRRSIETAKLVLGEVNPRMIRTYGENWCHVTEIDYFVHNEAPTGWGFLTSPREAPEHAREIADLVSTLVHDRDTVQIGQGTITEWVPRLGAFNNKLDLGLHSEITPRGLTKLIAGGVFTNKYKTLHAGKCIATAGGGARDDVQFIHMNPIFELLSIYDVVDPRVIAAHDNMVAINQGFAIDFTGQITAEGLGSLQWSGPGGQPIMAIGAQMARNGRYILVLPSTAKGGQVSRILPTLPEGTPITVTRNFADIVVTEYGIAYLRWKNWRERAQSLIAIAHPSFRGELEKAARRMFWPQE
jgi:4-hydroxybutyrate CoA-transferase